MRARDGGGRGRRRRLRRGPDRPPRSRSGSPSCSASRRRCSPSPGRWPTCWPSGRWSASARRCSASRSAHIARAELGAHGAFTGLTMRTWTDPRGHVDLAAIGALVAPDLGPFFVRDRVRVGREHPQLRRRPGPAARGAARRCARWPTTRGLARPPRRRADLERPRRHRRRARASSARVRRHDGASACPRGSARRSARSCSGSRRRDRRGAGLAQAARRRLAAGRRARGGRAVRRSTTTSTGSPTTTRTRGSSPRPCGVDPGGRRDEHRRRSRPPTRPGWSRGAGRGRAGRGGRLRRRTRRDAPRRRRPPTPSRGRRVR